ncbi:MAG: cell division protein FtsL [Myxococcales bacterium]|nr:cell division protein FtsL [Polyangiaceae bacterium]MDW8247894.1 cell division protein FtsL [Myxococcales bacterium]
MSHHRPFLILWVLAVSASVAAFVLHLAMRSKAMHLGYELGRARAEQARLREVRRVLELEVASYHTPQRVEVVARTLLRMEPPSPDRMIAMPPAGSPVAESPVATGAKGAGKVQAMVGEARSAVPLPAPPVATELIAPKVTPPKPLARQQEEP